LRRGELKTVNEILMKYASCIGLESDEARRTTAIGLGELAELYGSGDGSALIESIRRVGNQLAAERDPELQTLVSAAFVRLSQEAASSDAIPRSLASATPDRVRPRADSPPGVSTQSTRCHRRCHKVPQFTEPIAVVRRASSDFQSNARRILHQISFTVFSSPRRNISSKKDRTFRGGTHQDSSDANTSFLFRRVLAPRIPDPAVRYTTALEFRHGPSALLAKSGFSEALRFLCSSGSSSCFTAFTRILHVRSYPERSGSPHARQASATSADLAFHSVLERQAPQALVCNVTWLRTGIAESRD